MINRKDELKTMLTQRKALGTLCALLAPCCLLFGLIGYKYNLPNWYMSISATYYANSKLFMIGLLFATSIFFFSYKGYDWKDRACSLIEAIAAIGIVIFPCATDGIPDRVGLLCLPVKLSHTIHCVFAGTLFTTFAINILFLFTLSKGTMTKEKKIRNLIYRICGWTIVAFIILQILATTVLSKAIPSWFPMTWFVEFWMLEAFAFAYIVKSEAIPKFNDKLDSIPF